MATIPYAPPGVTVTEISTPSVNALLATETDICLVGLAGNVTTPVSPVTTTDTIILQGTTPVTLPTIAALNDDAQLISVSKVVDVLNPSYGTPLGAGYVATTDYTVQTGEGPPDGTAGTIARVSAGNIANGRLVAVTYTYLPTDYWNPVRLFDIGAVENRFGPAWATASNPTTGQSFYTGINSQLSMAARLAFANGAQSVICQPLFARATPGDPTTLQMAPTSIQVGNTTTWQDTLYVLRPITNLNVIVPIVGQDGTNVTDSSLLTIFGTVQSHLAFMNSQQQYIVALFGEDGTVEGVGTNTSGLMNTMRAVHVPSLQSNFGGAISSQCVMINNTVFQLPTPGSNGTTLNVGGQYCAAAVAGALAGRSVSSSLTRKSVIGFQSISDPRTQSDKNSDAGAGMMVLEQVNGLIRCRHSITLDNTHGAARAELSVIRAKFAMIESIRETLDNQIIGNIIADANSPLIVRSAISSVLSLLQQARVIVAYTQPQAAISSLDPTTIVASFAYLPSFPVNYITVTFKLDLTAGNIEVSQSAEVQNQG